VIVLVRTRGLKRARYSYFKRLEDDQSLMGTEVVEIFTRPGAVCATPNSRERRPTNRNFNNRLPSRRVRPISPSTRQMYYGRRWGRQDMDGGHSPVKCDSEDTCRGADPLRAIDHCRGKDGQET